MARRKKRRATRRRKSSRKGSGGDQIRNLLVLAGLGFGIYMIMKNQSSKAGSLTASAKVDGQPVAVSVIPPSPAQGTPDINAQINADLNA